MSGLSAAPELSSPHQYSGGGVTANQNHLWSVRVSYSEAECGPWVQRENFSDKLHQTPAVPFFPSVNLGDFSPLFHSFASPLYIFYFFHHYYHYHAIFALIHMLNTFPKGIQEYTHFVWAILHFIETNNEWGVSSHFRTATLAPSFRDWYKLTAATTWRENRNLDVSLFYYLDFYWFIEEHIVFEIPLKWMRQLADVAQAGARWVALKASGGNKFIQLEANGWLDFI